MSGGPEELTGVRGRVWSGSDHSHFVDLHTSSHNKQQLGESILPPHKEGRNFVSDRNPLHINIFRYNTTLAISYNRHRPCVIVP